MSHGLKLLLLASGTIITLMIVTAAIHLARQAKHVEEICEVRLEECYQDLACSDITMYDGLKVYGADVVNFMKRYLGSYRESETAPMKVTVVTSHRPKVVYTYCNKAYLLEIQNFTKSRYIKPLSEFLGAVTYNANGVIMEISFTVQ